MKRRKSLFDARTAGNKVVKGARTVEGEGGVPKVPVGRGGARAGEGGVTGQATAITGKGGAVAAGAPAGGGA